MRLFSGLLLRQGPAGGVYRLGPTVRFAATVSLQCAGKTNAGKLAGAISQRIRSDNLVQIEMIGPEAVYTAIKSVIIAGEYAKQDIEDKVLAVRQELVQLKDRVAPSGRTTDSTALRMHVAAVEPFKEIDHETTYISGDTNPGVAAGLLCRLVETKGMAPVACMGTAATSKALKAFIITGDYLGRNNNLGDNVLAFQVRKDWFKENGEAACFSFIASCTMRFRRLQKRQLSRIGRFNMFATGEPRRRLLRPETRIAHAPALQKSDDIWLCSGVSELLDSYDAFTLDQYGVLHNGREAYPGAAECVARMKAAGKPCVILSNYAGRAERQKEKLPDIGFDPDDLAGVVTSGELAHRYLSKQGKLGTRVLWIAWSEREKRGLGDFFEGLEDYTLVSNVEDADFILVSGVESRFAGTEAEEACDYERTGEHRLYRPLFRAAIQRMLPMICANPDLRVIRPSGWRAYLGGSLAAYYERLGGQVIYFGKPHSSAFEEARRQLCLAVAGDEERALQLELDEDFRICHVGDSLQHDVRGARSVGFAAAFVGRTGLHADDMGGQDAPLTKEGVRDLCLEHKVPLPQAALPRFQW